MMLERLCAIALCFTSACGASVLRPESFDDSGTARIWSGIRVEGRQPRRGGENLCLILVRFAEGPIILGPMTERIDERPLELNPGRYTLLFDQCIYKGCGADDIELTFDAKSGHTYQVDVRELSLNEASEVTASLTDAEEPNAGAISQHKKFCSHGPF
jgi:hypothetical protein